MIGIDLPIRGTITFLSFNQEKRSSLGLTQTAVSPSIVSGRVVATMIYLPSSPSTLYLN